MTSHVCLLTVDERFRKAQHLKPREPSAAVLSGGEAVVTTQHFVHSGFRENSIAESVGSLTAGTRKRRSASHKFRRRVSAIQRPLNIQIIQNSETLLFGLASESRSSLHFITSPRRSKSLAKMLNNICLLVLAVSVTSIDSCDPKSCPSVPKHYEELGCKPIKKSGECCATR